MSAWVVIAAAIVTAACGGAAEPPRVTAHGGTRPRETPARRPPPASPEPPPLAADVPIPSAVLTALAAATDALDPGDAATIEAFWSAVRGAEAAERARCSVLLREHAERLAIRGPWLLTSGQRGTRIWDLRTLELRTAMTGWSVFSEDGSTMLTRDGAVWVITDVDSLRTLGRIVPLPAGQTTGVARLARDGSRIYLGGGAQWERARLTIFDRTGRQIAQVDDLAGFTQLADRTRLLAIGPGPRLLLDARDGRRVASLNCDSVEPAGDRHLRCGADLMRVTDGTRAGMVPRTRPIYPLVSEQEGDRFVFRDADGGPVRGSTRAELGVPVAASPDGRFVALQTGSTRFAELATGRVTEPFDTHLHVPVFIRGTDRAVVIGRDATWIVRLPSGERLATFPIAHARHVEVAPEGERVLVHGPTEVWLWDGSGEPARLDAIRGEVTAVAWPRGRGVVTTGHGLRVHRRAGVPRRLVESVRVPALHPGELELRPDGTIWILAPSTGERPGRGLWRVRPGADAAEPIGFMVLRTDSHVVMGEDGTVVVRDIATPESGGRRVPTANGWRNRFALADDGTTLLAWTDGADFTADVFDDGEVEAATSQLVLVDLATHRETRLGTDILSVAAAWLTPDGRRALAVVGLGERYELRVWDTRTARVVGRRALSPEGVRGERDHGVIALAPDFSRAVVRGEAGRELICLPSGARISSLQGPGDDDRPGSIVDDEEDWVPDLTWTTAFTADARSLLAECRIFDGVRGRFRVELPGFCVGARLGGSAPRVLVLSHDRTRLQVFSIHDARVVAETRLPGDVRSLALDRSLGAAAARLGGAPPTVVELDAGRAHALADAEAGRPIAVSDDARAAVFLARDEPLARVFDTRTGRLRTLVHGDEWSIQHVVFDNQDRVWTLADDGLRAFPLDPATLVPAACAWLREAGVTLPPRCR